MKKSAKANALAARPDLDFSKGVRGKYNNLLAKGTNVAIIDPALLPFFPDSDSVNRALHAFLAIGESMQALSSVPRARRRAPSSTSAEFDPRAGIKPRQASR